jgi:hypothetical protein
MPTRTTIYAYHYILDGRRRGSSNCPPTHPGVSRTRYARSGELRIAYELRGILRRRPWLVLIQGLGFDRSGWKPVTRKLQRHFRLVLVDNRGTGRSDLPAASFGVADMASDVIAVLDGAGITQRGTSRRRAEYT